MFSKEESKKIRQEFWTFFGKRHPRKWLLYNTTIKDVVLKFSFDNKKAIVSLDSCATDPAMRAYYFEKFENLKLLLKEEVSQDLIFDKAYTLESGKVISRVYLQKDQVSIHNKQSWPEVFNFFNIHMHALESFFLEYQDIIKS